MYTATTHRIKVTVIPAYLESQSAAADNHYVWAYTIHLENMGERTVQLMNRYWKITDAIGTVQEVRGAGVIGEQPILKPGDVYNYTSGTALTTPSGIMAGYYEMTTPEGDSFIIEIPAFSLDSSEQINRPN